MSQVVPTMTGLAQRSSTGRNSKTSLFTVMTSTQMTYLRCFSRIQAISMTCLAGYSCKWDSNSREEAIGARIISILSNCSGAIHTLARSDPREGGSLFQHRLVPEVSDSLDREDLHSNNK
jgi:hypothetical protein